METNETPLQKLIKESSESAFHAFAFSELFSNRKRRYSFYMRIVSGFGIGVPALIGYVLIGHLFSVNINNTVLTFAGLLMAFQFGLSLWAFLFDWANELSYASNAAQAYNTYWVRFKKFANYPPDTYEALRTDYDLLMAEIVVRNQMDGQCDIKNWEIRRGHRAALYEFKWKCLKCGLVPESLESTDCKHCGNFKWKLFKS